MQRFLEIFLISLFFFFIVHKCLLNFISVLTFLDKMHDYLFHFLQHETFRNNYDL